MLTQLTPFACKKYNNIKDNPNVNDDYKNDVYRNEINEILKKAFREPLLLIFNAFLNKFESMDEYTEFRQQYVVKYVPKLKDYQRFIMDVLVAVKFNDSALTKQFINKIKNNNWYDWTVPQICEYYGYNGAKLLAREVEPDEGEVNA